MGVPDISKKTTPDLKNIKNTSLLYIDLSPNVAINTFIENSGIEFKNAFIEIQNLIKQNKILAGHDISDGGLFCCCLEMAFAGNLGLVINLPEFIKPENGLSFLLNEQLGVVIQVLNTDITGIMEKMRSIKVKTMIIAKPVNVDTVVIQQKQKVFYTQKMTLLRSKWEYNSKKLEKHQCNIKCVEQEYNLYATFNHPKHYSIPESVYNYSVNKKGNIAVLREDGTNSERELAAAFYHAGYTVYDIHTRQLNNNPDLLDTFDGLAFAGGFSFADTLGAGKGWSQIIKQNKKLHAKFKEFYENPKKVFNWNM